MTLNYQVMTLLSEFYTSLDNFKGTCQNHTVLSGIEQTDDM